MNIFRLISRKEISIARNSPKTAPYVTKDENDYSHWLPSKDFKAALAKEREAKATLNLMNFDLNTDQKERILQIRDLAVKQGIKDFEIELEDQKYKVDTASLNLRTVV